MFSSQIIIASANSLRGRSVFTSWLFFLVTVITLLQWRQVEADLVSCSYVQDIYEGAACCLQPEGVFFWPNPSSCDSKRNILLQNALDLLDPSGVLRNLPGCNPSVSPSCDLVITSRRVVLSSHLYVRSLNLTNSTLRTNGYGLFVVNNIYLTTSIIDGSATAGSISWSAASGPLAGGDGAQAGLNASPITIGGSAGGRLPSEAQYLVYFGSVDYFNIALSLSTIRRAGGPGGSGSTSSENGACSSSALRGAGGAGGSLIFITAGAISQVSSLIISRGSDAPHFSAGAEDSPANNFGGGGGGGAAVIVTCDSPSSSTLPAVDFTPGLGGLGTPTSGEQLLYS